MFNVNYTGLRKRETYNEIVDYLEHGQEKIKYPDRRATQIRNSLYMTNLLDGDGDMEKQQNKAMKNTEVEHRIIEEASRTNSTAQHLRMDTGGFNTPNSGYSFGSQLPPSENLSELIDMIDDLVIEQDGIDQQREARGKMLMQDHFKEVNAQAGFHLQRKVQLDDKLEIDTEDMTLYQVNLQLFDFYKAKLLSNNAYKLFNESLKTLEIIKQQKEDGIITAEEAKMRTTDIGETIRDIYHSTKETLKASNRYTISQAASSSNSMQVAIPKARAITRKGTKAETDDPEGPPRITRTIKKKNSKKSSKKTPKLKDLN
jgi:hypothetical protein